VIPIFKPLIEEDEISAASDALRRGWLGMGSYVDAFEQALKVEIGAEDRHVVALGTGSAALHLALLIADVGPGDEVITPAFNNISDLQAILASGAQPVLCDIDDLTLSVDFADAEKVVSPRTKAIIVMDYGCMLADHDAARRFAQRHRLRVVHDAAHSFGSSYKRKPIGSFSDLCIFSFDPVKTVTCIDGGALVVQNTSDVERLHEMRLLGMSQPIDRMYRDERAFTYDVRQQGFRYHLSNAHGAIGLAQLKKLPQIVASRRAACEFYNTQFRAVGEVKVPETDFAGSAPFLYYIRVPARARDALRAFLREHGIDTGVHWQPAHWFKLFKKCKRTELLITERVANEILTLPLHSCMAESDLVWIVDRIRTFFKH
jgi:dTDP-4-amino-4,6-dideoxygalactose transaminase